jgi:hypothetical protein
MSQVQEQLGTNLTVEETKDEFVLRINKNERNGRSKSGKTTIVATSSGIQEHAGVCFGINVFVKDKK